MLVSRRQAGMYKAAPCNFCAERIDHNKVPETWTLGNDPLQRKANGKMHKRMLRERLTTSLKLVNQKDTIPPRCKVCLI